MAKKSKKIVELPGIEGPGVAAVSIPAIDALAEDYIKERDKRCDMTPREIAAKQKLIEAIHDHADKIGRNKDGVITYRFEDQLIELAPGKEKLKVKAIKANGETDEE